ncbi:hypothetical protein Taro_002144 [Colocasia esculenta]|uniref:Uncharacterized protein n=1 Tax=Colocasia esculenta TaxID=4460 RepID=A0A843TKU7_COLES|nr:hypothetical protein [Colocasia esculenta]
MQYIWPSTHHNSLACPLRICPTPTWTSRIPSRNGPVLLPRAPPPQPFCFRSLSLSLSRLLYHSVPERPSRRLHPSKSPTATGRCKCSPRRRNRPLQMGGGRLLRESGIGIVTVGILKIRGGLEDCKNRDGGGELFLLRLILAV